MSKINHLINNFLLNRVTYCEIFDLIENVDCVKKNNENIKIIFDNYLIRHDVAEFWWKMMKMKFWMIKKTWFVWNHFLFDSILLIHFSNQQRYWFVHFIKIHFSSEIQKRLQKKFILKKSIDSWSENLTKKITI